MGVVLAFRADIAAPKDQPASVEHDRQTIRDNCLSAAKSVQTAIDKMAAMADLGQGQRPGDLIRQGEHLIHDLRSFDPLAPGAKEISMNLLSRIHEMNRLARDWALAYFG